MWWWFPRKWSWFWTFQSQYASRWGWEWSLRVEVVVKMVITRRGGAENGHFALWWCWKWSLRVEVVLKMVISRRGGTENGPYASRWYWKWSFRVEVVLKMVLTRRGGTENGQIASRWCWKWWPSHWLNQDCDSIQGSQYHNLANSWLNPMIWIVNKIEGWYCGPGPHPIENGNLFQGLYLWKTTF